MGTEYSEDYLDRLEGQQGNPTSTLIRACLHVQRRILASLQRIEENTYARLTRTQRDALERER